ncbi:hypothetical protein BD413DRAFT_540661 [Trametes elegans]|nr:hypothetical protein BD413DRAFT_540661 [Trametes elegans]
MCRWEKFSPRAVYNSSCSSVLALARALGCIRSRSGMSQALSTRTEVGLAEGSFLCIGWMPLSCRCPGRRHIYKLPSGMLTLSLTEQSLGSQGLGCYRSPVQRPSAGTEGDVSPLNQLPTAGMQEDRVGILGSEFLSGDAGLHLSPDHSLNLRLSLTFFIGLAPPSMPTEPAWKYGLLDLFEGDGCPAEASRSSDSQ